VPAIRRVPSRSGTDLINQRPRITLNSSSQTASGRRIGRIDRGCSSRHGGDSIALGHGRHLCVMHYRALSRVDPEMNPNNPPPSPLPLKIDMSPLIAAADTLDWQNQQLSSELKRECFALRIARFRTFVASSQRIYLTSADQFRRAIARTIGLRVGAAMIVGTLTGSIAVAVTRSPVTTVRPPLDCCCLFWFFIGLATASCCNLGVPFGIN
jgi:hypothetical protein